MLIKNLDTLRYSPRTPLRRVLRALYRGGAPIGLVCAQGGVLLGVVTQSDIKQALMRGIDPHTPVREVMNTRFVSAREGASPASLQKLARSQSPYGTGSIGKVPLLDEKGRLRGLYLSQAAGKSRQSVLVTGGAGYLGSIVCRLLLERGYRVVALDKLLFGDHGVRDLKRNEHFKLIEGNIADIGTLVQIIPTVDCVIHLAGIVGDPASSLNPLQTMEENHFATKMLIELCRYYQVPKFVFASSCSVYGATSQVLNETSRPNPVSLYARSKLYSERDILKYAGGDFHPVILRFGTLYGLSPRMRFDLVVNAMTAHAHFNKRILVDGGEQWRPLLHVEDAARACLAALEAPWEVVSGEIFNVGDTAENYRISDIARAVQKAVPGALIDTRDTVKDRRDYRVSFSKIHRVLKFRTKHRLHKSIAPMLAQMKKGEFRAWAGKRYNNFLTQRELFDR